MNGHGDVLLGAVCGDKETIKQIGEREHYLRGNLLGPFEAWLALQGLCTFPNGRKGLHRHFRSRLLLNAG